jgi:hypothetical protein
MHHIFHSIWYFKFYKRIFDVILMLHPDTKAIILTEITIVTILTLPLPSLSVYGFSPTLHTADFEPNSYIDKSEIMNNTKAELSTKI